MQPQKSKNLGCLTRVLGILLAVLAIVLVGGKFYTDRLVREAEARYPPAEFVTVEGMRLHYLQVGSGGYFL